MAIATTGTPQTFGDSNSAGRTGLTRPTTTTGALIKLYLYIETAFDPAADDITFSNGTWELESQSVNTLSTPDFQLLVFRSVYAGEGSTFNMTFGTNIGSVWNTGFMHAFTGQDSTQPDVASSTNSGSSSTATGTGITIANTGAYLVFAEGDFDARNLSSYSTGLTELTDFGNLAIAADDNVSAGATGNKTASIGAGGSEWIVHLGAIRPAASAISINLAPVAIPVVQVTPSITLGAASINLAPVTVPINVVTPGVLATHHLAPVAIPLLAIAPSITLGSVSVNLAPTTIPVEVVTPTISLGGVSVALEAVAIPLVVPAGSFGATLAINLSPVETPLALPGLTITLGGVSQDIGPVSIPITPVSPAIVLGGVGVALAPVAVPVVPVDPSVTLGAVSRALAPVAVPVLPIAPSIALGAAQRALDPVPVAVVPVTPTISLGVANIDGTPVLIVVEVPQLIIAEEQPEQLAFLVYGSYRPTLELAGGGTGLVMYGSYKPLEI